VVGRVDGGRMTSSTTPSISKSGGVMMRHQTGVLDGVDVANFRRSYQVWVSPNSHRLLGPEIWNEVCLLVTGPVVDRIGCVHFSALAGTWWVELVRLNL
jgi:hypothetical protein